MSRVAKAKDYSGKTFRGWTVIGPSQKDPQKWVVRCNQCKNVYERLIAPIAHGLSGGCNQCSRARMRALEHQSFVQERARKVALTEGRMQSGAPTSSSPGRSSKALGTPKSEIQRQLLMALREWIVSQRRSQTVVAERLGVGRSAVSEILNLHSRWSAERLLALWVGIGGQWHLELTMMSEKKNDVSVHVLIVK